MKFNMDNLFKPEVNFRETEMDFFNFMRKIKNGKIVLCDDFQSVVIADSEIIEFVKSLQFGLRLPVIYANQDMDGIYTILNELKKIKIMIHLFNNHNNPFIESMKITMKYGFMSPEQIKRLKNFLK